MSCRGRRSEEQSGEVARRYDRLAGVYDIWEIPMDRLGGEKRRRCVLSAARGDVLEVGIGTGLNLECYPAHVELSGIDISAGMLEHARNRAHKHDIAIRLEVADVEDLPFEDASFDTVTATCVFCSVADPVEGLREVGRVVKPNGSVLLLEHVRPRNRLLGWLFDRLNPLARRLFGPNINRRTEDNIDAAGLNIVDIHRSGIWREIQARPGRGDHNTNLRVESS